MSQKTINQNKRNLEGSAKINYKMDYHTNQSELHNDGCWRVFKYLRKQGYTVVSEAVFKNKLRADLYCLDTDVIYEIVVSEKAESLEKKKSTHDSIIIVLNANDIIGLTDEELEKLL